MSASDPPAGPWVTFHSKWCWVYSLPVSWDPLSTTLDLHHPLHHSSPPAPEVFQNPDEVSHSTPQRPRIVLVSPLLSQKNPSNPSREASTPCFRMNLPFPSHHQPLPASTSNVSTDLGSLWNVSECSGVYHLNDKRVRLFSDVCILGLSVNC